MNERIEEEKGAWKRKRIDMDRERVRKEGAKENSEIRILLTWSMALEKKIALTNGERCECDQRYS